MACVSSFHLFSSNVISVKSPKHLLSYKSLARKSISFFGNITQVRPIFQVRSSFDGFSLDEGKGVKDEGEVDELKKKLLESFYGIDRGSRASSETSAEISELITRLEAQDSTTDLAKCLELLDGKWDLVYTSFAPLFPLLFGETQKLLKVSMSETIDSNDLKVQQSVQFLGNLDATSLFVNGTFEVKGLKRVEVTPKDIKVEITKVSDYNLLPEHVEFLGVKLNLSALNRISANIQHTSSSIISSNLPSVISFLKGNIQLWVLPTYVDGNLRIVRGDRGCIFVFAKEGFYLV
ncbi:prolyl aminopeptidase [Ranunculus cassubicifolius]